jgi:predicted small secreted protein
MKKITFIAMLMILPLAISACHTIQGMGEDLQAGGRAIDKAAGSSSSSSQPSQ